MPEAIHADDGDGRVLISSFFLAGSLFGILASGMREIAKPGRITKVCNAPDFVCGIRSLRGSLITVIDLAARLGLRARSLEPGEDSRLLIVEWRSEIIALLVDGSVDSLIAEKGDLLPQPAGFHGAPGLFLAGVCRDGERLIALLSVDSILDVDQDKRL